MSFPRLATRHLERITVALGLLVSLSGCAESSQPVTAARVVTTEDAASRRVVVTVARGASWQVPRAGTTGGGYRADYETSPRARGVVRALARDYDLREVDGWPIEVLGVHCVVFEVAEGTSVDDATRRLEADRRVESVQALQLFDVQDGYDDPYAELQHAAGELQISEAHRWADGKGVTVVVVDTGVDASHPELERAVRTTRDFVGDEAGPFGLDVHGTAVVGLMASAPNNGLGIVGVAPNADVVAVRACWQVGARGERASCNSFTLAKALAFALDRRPDVLNLSLAGPPDPLLERLLQLALDRGTIVVAARSGDDCRFPTCLDGVIGVSAAGTLEGLAAPGRDLITTVPGGGFDFMSGSSFAAAQVSGVAALVRQLRPGISSEELVKILDSSSVRVDRAGEESVIVVNACRAVAAVVDGADCSV